MPIPDFDGILNVLPPHLGNPTKSAELSPYRCTTEELCRRFSTSNARREILRGFMSLRGELLELGVEGFQWLDGSFVEDIETLDSRVPRDIDVVTFVSRPSDPSGVNSILGPRPELWRLPMVKQAFHVDHYVIPLGSDPEALINHAQYWYGLFSHRRDGTWKGMLRVELEATADDSAAWHLLGDLA